MILQNLQNMLISKSCFGITSNENFVFILGGFIQYNSKSKSCEKFDIIKNIWMKIKNLNFAYFGIG